MEIGQAEDAGVDAEGRLQEAGADGERQRRRHGAVQPLQRQTQEQVRRPQFPEFPGLGSESARLDDTRVQLAEPSPERGTREDELSLEQDGPLAARQRGRRQQPRGEDFVEDRGAYENRHRETREQQDETARRTFPVDFHNSPMSCGHAVHFSRQREELSEPKPASEEVCEAADEV